MNPTIEKYVSIILSAALGLIATQPWAKDASALLMFLAGGLGGYVIPNAKSRALAVQQRASLVPPALMLLAVVTLATQPACGGFGDMPAADTLEALDQVCAVRAENRSTTDAVAGEVDRQVAAQPEAAPAADAAKPEGAGEAAVSGGEQEGGAPASAAEGPAAQ